MAQTHNHDICGLVRRIDRFMFELHKSVSSNTSKVNSYDTERLQSYLDAMSFYLDWVQGQPQLDLPESAPTLYELADPHDLQDVESEDINDLLRLLKLVRIELVDSQSSRDPAGLNQFDERRARDLIAKCNAFLSGYLAQTNPIDLPESSPKAASSGQGRTGI